jgi:hypothetical protein
MNLTAYFALSGCSETSNFGTGSQFKEKNMIDNAISKQPVAQPASGFVTDLENGGIAIIKYKGQDKAICIPETIDGKPVTGIGERAFMDCRSLISITIPESVASIGAMAFFRCFSLKAISVSPENQCYKDIGGVLFTKDG